MYSPKKYEFIATVIFLAIAVVAIMFLCGCGTPHTLLFTKTENGSEISTDPNDKSFGLFRKALPKGDYVIKPTEYGVEGEADFKPDFKLMEVVINKNEGL